MRFKKIIIDDKKSNEQELYYRFPWLMDAEFEDAIVEVRNNVLTWKNGIWRCGIWIDGVWLDGVWFYGEWLKGIWGNGIWCNGVWYDGLWNDGTWFGGDWYCGTWLGGSWGEGKMWNNILQKMEEIEYVNGKFYSVKK